MKYTAKTVIFNEIPNEVSLCYSISGCGKRCLGCHSSELWEEKENHNSLNIGILEKHLTEYCGMITAIVFLGGEWHEKELISMLTLAKKFQLKTCLYTSINNLEEINIHLLNVLDYIKIGEFYFELGGLNSKKTNQRFIEVKSGKILNNLFQKN